MNTALLAKHSWRLLHSDNLWSGVLKHKYLVHCFLMEAVHHKYQYASSTWRAILSGAELLLSGLSWRVGNGADISFWEHSWSPCGELSQLATRMLSANWKSCTVREVLGSSNWHLERLNHYLPRQVLLQVRAMHFNPHTTILDSLIWQHNPE